MNENDIPMPCAFEAKRLAAMLGHDLKALEGMLADGLLYVHSSGERDTKRSLLEALASGRLRYLAARFDEQAVIEANGALVASGKMTATVLKNGQERNVRSLYMAVWSVLAEGEGRLLAYQGTPIL